MIKMRLAVLCLCALGMLSQAIAVPEGDKPDGSSILVPRQAVEGLTGSVVFEVLLAELAGYRGDLKGATELYLDLMQKTKDPKMAEQAFRLAANDAKLRGLAIKSAEMWFATDRRWVAQSAYARSLLWRKRASAALQVIDGYLRAHESERTKIFLQLPQLLENTSQYAVVLNQGLAWRDQYPHVPEAYFAAAQLANAAKNMTLALSLVDQALALRPEWELAVLFKAELVLVKSGTPASVALLQQFVSAYPHAVETRVTLVKVLMSLHDYQAAEPLLLALVDELPHRADLFFMLGAVQVQIGRLDEAEQAFIQSESLGFYAHDAILLALGQLACLHQDYQAAKAHYELIELDSNYASGMNDLVGILLEVGRGDEALVMLEQSRLSHPTSEPFLLMLQARVLRKLNRLDEEWRVLQDAILRYPDDPDVIFAYAMAQESRQEYAGMEKSLRHLIVLKPESALGYNALGYHWADTNSHLEEATILLSKALALEPESPAVLDSMGWLQFRLGHVKQALEFIDRAYKMEVDPEVGAHRVEILWHVGRHDEAADLFKLLRETFPSNDLVVDVGRRLGF